MILNDALYTISSGRRGKPFSEIIVQDYNFYVSLDGKKMLELIQKDMYETKELLNNEILELGCSMGEEDYDAEWAMLYENLSSLADVIDDNIDSIAIESVTDGESLMYIILDRERVI